MEEELAATTSTSSSSREPLSSSSAPVVALPDSDSAGESETDVEILRKEMTKVKTKGLSTGVRNYMKWCEDKKLVVGEYENNIEAEEAPRDFVSMITDFEHSFLPVFVWKGLR